MNTSQKKQPLLFIGLIVFLAVAVIGIIYDFIAKAGGMAAIISVAAAFLILGVILVVDTVLRRKAAAQTGEPAEEGEDRQFIRHTGEQKEDDAFSWNTEGESSRGFAGFRPRSEQGGVDWAASFESGNTDDFEQLPDTDFGGFEDDLDPGFTMDDGESAEPASFDAEDDFDDIPAQEDVAGEQPEETFTEEADAQEQEADELPAEDEPQEDDPFRPVLKLDGAQQEEAPAEEAEPETAEETEPEAAAEPEAELPTEPAPKPASPRKTAAYAAAPAPVVAAVGGRTIESFYDEMSDEDILYRDCVEVWAADAKPAALRLIKYVEGIEDKQTAALIGREVEYVNAMIDRINCFTQLEYIDELLEYKEHNYSTLVKDCLKRFSPFFMEKRLGLLWKGLDINVLTDRRWFIFALTQVIFNAVEFTPNGGKIAISAKKYEDFIDLTVEDSGKGIAPEELPFIFMAGYMGDDAPNESGRRTGMGLFIAQSVMRKMGGDMLAESVQGKGTRITLRMPIIDPLA